MTTQYLLSWITDQLAVGHAPMSYAELDSLKSQGIGAIVNLCAEFCDLHEIEGKYGFEVYYLPVHDDEAPAEPELERALDWLDEAIYLGKKVLVHCRHGIGRTGTFVTAFLLRKGFGLKHAQKVLKRTRANHSSFYQWWLLRKYSKKSGRLTIREPSLESKHILDLRPFFHDHEMLLARVDGLLRQLAAAGEDIPSCGLETDACCYELLDLSFIETVYLSYNMNRRLTSLERRGAIDRAVSVTGRIRQIRENLTAKGADPFMKGERFRELYRADRILCPLSIDSCCTMYDFRPVACRLFGLPRRTDDLMLPGPGNEPMDRGSHCGSVIDEIRSTLKRSSVSMFHALSSFLFNERELTFTLADAVSGRFTQKYFELLQTCGRGNGS